MFAPPMNSIISSLSSPLHSFHTYADPQEPAKILARAHQELNHRFLQERLLQVTSPSLLSNPLLISNPPPPPSLGSHYFPGAPNFVPPFLSPLANSHSIVLQSILISK
ncbi:hypothetical protein HELRODRAFT_192370 [Helobdella robusta]|uniref:Uncharacterized protein n=1 Tax=Helobdella robusta TaxID=6412 RepID=T1FTV4_HELRO|nr:hypothetical protein HELRODRAFT_192370 [Helobdella robusta]ESO01086.1 hypothetical protein HELRODRAFT_192370 [Helobdella robusta]